MTTDALETVFAKLASDDAAAIDRLVDWLRIPSVSTDPAYAGDCQRAADWIADQLRACGFEKVEVLPTGDPPGSGRPIVVAETPGVEGYDGPHVLMYGHYDVQPADPVELWDSPPFEPVIKPAEGEIGERVVARGAVDDKGQVMMFIEALRAWHEAGMPAANGVRMTVMIEGEEESGSVNLERFVEQHRDQLAKADVCVISDTAMLGRGKPAITYGIRGLTYTEITLHGPDQDLHSGSWGGRVANPLNELCRILGGLWDDDRRVTIPGFYDRVREIEQQEREAWAGLGLDAADALAGIGVGPDGDVGEAGFTSVEREWGRPTAEVHGIVGGYQGPGAKTVIPSHASAKVSFRLVADQDPDEIRDAFFAWLRARTPGGMRWELHDHGGGHPASVPVDWPPLQVAGEALRRA
ncbi:MAG: M20/M25/M40 family metallo-hydrolase, partial [Planctomycetota bacterium]